MEKTEVTMKEEMIRELDKDNRRKTVAQFECTRNCFSCPFPGSKCVGNSDEKVVIR